MFKKIITVILCLLTFPVYSKNILPNVQGRIHLDGNRLIFSLDRLLYSYSFYITGYELSFENDNECTKVYISLLYTNHKSKKRIDSINKETGKREIIIPWDEKLNSLNLLFFYKDSERITELSTE